MELSPDQTIFWQQGFVTINATLVYTWITMALLAGGSWLITRNLSTGKTLPVRQGVLEAIVSLISRQIAEVMMCKPGPFIPFLGGLFLFIATSNLFGIIPGYRSPTGSLSTTAALAMSVFIAVPAYGIRSRGVLSYLKQYVQPNVIMLPFNIIGDLSRTMAMAVRLFGNIMSGDLIVAILLSIVPLFFPIIMQMFGLLTGLIQAYIFTVLAAVFIASGMSSD